MECHAHVTHMARPSPMELAPKFPWSLERSSWCPQTSGAELVHGDFVSLLASLRISSPKIIGDIGWMTARHSMCWGTSTNLKIFILASKPQVCEPATQHQPLVSISKFHVRYGARMLINLIFAGRAYRQKSNVKTMVGQTMNVLPNHLQNAVGTTLAASLFQLPHWSSANQLVMHIAVMLWRRDFMNDSIT